MSTAEQLCCRVKSKRRKRDVVATQVRPLLWRVDVDMDMYYDLAPRQGSRYPAAAFFPGDEDKKRFTAIVAGRCNKRSVIGKDGKWTARYSFNIQITLA